MSDVSISRTLFSYVIDPQVVGYDASIFTTTSGTPAVASNKYRWNAAGSRLDYQLLFGEVSVPLTIPTAPTSGHSRRIGFKTYGPSNKGSVYFDITGAVLSAKVVTNAGTTYTEEIPWNSNWTNAETFFRVSWDEKMANFTVGSGSNQARVTIVVGPTELLNIPAYFVLESGVSDNMDASYIQILNAARVATLSSSGIITEITPGTGATNLGKAEDSAHASGDTGVAVWAKRTDTPASSAGTDGDYATINQDSLGHLWSREGFAPGFENNTDQVAMTLPRAVATNTGVVSLDVSSALETSSVTKASAGRLYALSGYIDATAPSATYYIQILNASSLPADGAVTHLVEPKQIVHATGSPSYFSYDYGLFGRYASTGIVVCISSTQFTKTISGAYLAMTAAYL